MRGSIVGDLRLDRRAPDWRSERNILWIEKHCRVPEGRDVGKPIVLREWQRDIIRLIYDNPAGTRQAIISMPRKNGKTALISLILLLHLVGHESVPNGQLYSAGQSREQAAVVFRLAALVVRQSPDLKAAIGIRDTAKQLYAPERGTVYRALSAEASTAYGLSPALVVHDELGQVKGPTSELYDALETAMGAHQSPLSVVISTQAPTDNDLMSRLVDMAATGNDPKLALKVYTAPVEADPFSEETLAACNPAWGDFLNADEVRRNRDVAREMPSQEASYRNLHLNQRVEVNDPFISSSVWKACGGEVVPDFKGLPVFAGLDLSEVADLTAFVPMAPVDGIWHVRPVFWLPGEGLREKSRSDRVPWDTFAKQGWLRTTPGRTIDYKFVAAFLWDFVRENDVRKIAFDRYNWRHLKPWLAEAGFHDAQLEGDNAIFEPFAQSFPQFSPALRDLESWFLDRKIRHGDHPVLEICAANTIVVMDDNGNRKLSKRKSHGRIDGMVALAMAVSVASTFEQVPFDAFAMIA